MIDRYVLPVQRTVLAPPARILAAAGVSADQLSLAGFGIGLLGVVVLSAGWYGAGLALVLLNRLFDGLDGAVARLNGPTDRGAFLDITLDFFFYALVPLAFAFADPASNAVAACLLICAFVGTGSSFLGFAAIAARRGLGSEDYPMKGIYYLGGLTEGAETIAVFVLMCLWPQAFAPLALAFAGLCLITTLTRCRMGWMLFGEEATTERIV